MATWAVEWFFDTALTIEVVQPSDRTESRTLKGSIGRVREPAYPGYSQHNVTVAIGKPFQALQAQ